MTESSPPKVILGIDPGLNITGYGVINVVGSRIELLEAGVIRGGAAVNPIGKRLLAIHQGVSEVIENFRPATLSLEQLYSHYARPQTAILMGHARGAICLAAAEADVPICSYAATAVKKMLTGSGRAPKAQIQLAICREFGLASAPEPADVADALAIALCHAFQQKTTATMA